MKKLTLLALIAVLLCAFTSNMAFAGTKAGNTEIAANISVSKSLNDNNDSTIYQVATHIGYFLTDAIQIGIAGLVSGDFDDSDSTVGYAGAAVDYHFNTSGNTVPYVGLGVGAFIFAGEPELAGEGRVGIKQFVSERVSINYLVSYQRSLDSDSDDDGTVRGSIGLGFYF